MMNGPNLSYLRNDFFFNFPKYSPWNHVEQFLSTRILHQSWHFPKIDNAILIQKNNRVCFLSFCYLGCHATLSSMCCVTAQISTAINETRKINLNVIQCHCLQSRITKSHKKKGLVAFFRWNIQCAIKAYCDNKLAWQQATFQVTCPCNLNTDWLMELQNYSLKYYVKFGIQHIPLWMLHVQLGKTCPGWYL